MNTTTVGSGELVEVHQGDTLHTDRKSRQKLFWGCFIVLVASAFGFVFRSFLMAQWGVQFGLSKTQQGEIFGVSFWPFGISIVLFSFIIDKVGYKKSMIFAFVCHIASVVLTIMANGYWMLYVGTLLFALGNGAAEAVVNPVVATMFAKDKTKWLNILHAGWPTGMVLAGLLGIGMIHLELRWEIIIGFILLPVIVYGWLIMNRNFPVNERVKAGISYLEMLKEVGVLGILIIVALCAFQLGSLFGWSHTVSGLITAAIVGVFGFFVRSLGRPLFIMLLLLMIPLATTELGTDSWITDLMTPEMAKVGFQGGWVLVYTSVIMAVLRFYSGPIVHKFSPLGLLAVSAFVAAAGLQLLSYSAGIVIIVAATIYALGKTFFWGTMLGVVSEQFPKGGALALNFTGAVGQVGVGVIGAVFLGAIQDKELDQNLAVYDRQHQTELHMNYITEEKTGLFGEYKALDADKLENASPETLQTIAAAQDEAKKDALRTVALLPALMFVVYLGLMFYYRSKGGYKPVVILEEERLNE
ncbi:sugar MFS transporter [Pontibacter sp. SGAir0037]|uniref:MFS transporter n=1 Tax=Pontibacter sp. SGAir0037 TaxID=2571030 RepID=UPI0010CD3751|nr:MFS transporter [Pontibacter sp. SGAir0037]QCR24827.1 MFS transporter [Pontibacter sp. SGAir0037]